MRGLYEIRPVDAVASARLAVEDPWVLAMKLWSPSYIGGWSAAGHWGFTEQLFRSTFVVIAASVRHAEQSIGGTSFRVAHRTWDEMTGIARVWRSGSPVNVATAERTVVDACEHPSWVGGGRMLAGILRDAVESASFSLERLNSEIHNGISGAGAGRLGFLLERFAPDSTALLSALRALRKTGYVRLDPAVPIRGRLATRWGIWVNVSLDSSDS
jgi:predicted transcriptional regulator of viral defense system